MSLPYVLQWPTTKAAPDSPRTVAGKSRWPQQPEFFKFACDIVPNEEFAEVNGTVTPILARTKKAKAKANG